MKNSKGTRAARALRRPSAEVRAQTEFDETYLRLHGWWQSDEGWRHRAYAYPWPVADAKRITEETEAGEMDLVNRMLRGES